MTGSLFLVFLVVILGKKRKKLEQVEDAISKQTEVVQSRTGSKDDSLHKARLLTHQNNKMREAKERKAEGLEEVDVEPLSDEFLAEELKNIEPIKDDKKPEYYKTKIMRAQRDLEKERQKRNLAESNPLVAFEKFQRAEKDLDSKMEQIDRIEDTIASLKEDVRGRKERWKQFRCAYTYMQCIHDMISPDEIYFNSIFLSIWYRVISTIQRT